MDSPIGPQEGRFWMKRGVVSLRVATLTYRTSRGGTSNPFSREPGFPKYGSTTCGTLVPLSLLQLENTRRSSVSDSEYPENPGGWIFRGARVSQVTGPSSSAVPQSSTPPVPLRLAFSASGSAAFRVGEPLSIRNEGFEAAFLRPTRSPDYASTAPSRIQLQVWLPACWLHFGWVGLAPTG